MAACDTVRTLDPVPPVPMMLPTHVLAGLVLALPVASVAPELAPAAFAGGAVGGVLPDLDMYAGHRRTLHYPVYYPLAAVPAVAAAALLRTPVLVGLALVLVAAALHCRMDELGGSLELRPWAASSERGVYDHYSGEWRAPRRWISYDGSPRDLVGACVLAAPLLWAGPVQVRWLVAALLAVAATYTVFRKRLADLAEWAVQSLPATVATYVPGRYREG